MYWMVNEEVDFSDFSFFKISEKFPAFFKGMGRKVEVEIVEIVELGVGKVSKDASSSLGFSLMVKGSTVGEEGMSVEEGATGATGEATSDRTGCIIFGGFSMGEEMTRGDREGGGDEGVVSEGNVGDALRGSSVEIGLEEEDLYASHCC